MKYSQDKLEELLKFEGIVLSSDGFSYENSGKEFHFEKFPCYYCLIKYDTWDESRKCREWHMVMTPDMIPLQMVR